MSARPAYTLPYSFGVCRRFLDGVVRVSDDDLCVAMRQLFDGMKLAVEPAAASGIAALLGPLRTRLEGKRVGVILSGTTTDPQRFAELIARG